MRLGISHKRRRLRIAPVIALLIFIAAVFALTRLHAAYVTAARAYANNVATTAVNEAVAEAFNDVDNADFGTAMSVDRATVVTSDTARINTINARISERIQSAVTANDYKTAYIPIGAVTGIAALSGAGVKIPVKVHPVSLVNTDFDERFESAGINQVRHTILLNVEIETAYSGYLLYEKETVKVNVPISDAVIVGDTPEFYGGGEIFAGEEVRNEGNGKTN